MRWVAGVLSLAMAVLFAPAARAQATAVDQQFLGFIRVQAVALRAEDRSPQSPDEWQQRRRVLRARLQAAWGDFPAEPCPLEPRQVGIIEREGYRIEKLLLQTRPGVWMTANAYVPAAPGPHPAVLCVHGHWRFAKQDPVVQARCLGLVRHGFLVLCVDAFGAGERAVGEALGEYHGEMTAATLLPAGQPLSGLQVYENMRAIDYLQTRPDVDRLQIGVTGASGGGNQTMYAGAWDERLQAVVPVCSVGNYQAYLGPACCMCEVVPGALRFTEEGDVLGLVAPRGLLVISATQDASQFSVAAAQPSLARAADIFALFQVPERLRHTVIESGHDYNRAMREAMYGWMARQLQGRGDGQPLPEAEFQTEEPESLRCYPGDSRPDDYVTIPRFAAAEAARILARHPIPASRTAWHELRASRLHALREKTLGGFPAVVPLEPERDAPSEAAPVTLEFTSEPGIRLVAHAAGIADVAPRVAILLDLDAPFESLDGELGRSLREAGWSVVVPELRATGRFTVPGDRIGHAPDHNSAEWSLWIGRPLLGQWTWDVRRTIEALPSLLGQPPARVALVGRGSAGVVALCAAVMDERVSQVVTVNALASYVTPEPYRQQRLGIMAPGILADVGDIAHLAALLAPRRLCVAGGVSGTGQPLSAAELTAIYEPTRRIYALEQADAQLTRRADAAPDVIVAALEQP